MWFGKEFTILKYTRKMYERQMTPDEVKKITSLERKHRVLIDNRDSILKNLNHTLTQLFIVEQEIDQFKTKPNE